MLRPSTDETMRQRIEKIIMAIRSAGIEGLIEAEVLDGELITAFESLKHFASAPSEPLCEKVYSGRGGTNYYCEQPAGAPVHNRRGEGWDHNFVPPSRESAAEPEGK